MREAIKMLDIRDYQGNPMKLKICGILVEDLTREELIHCLYFSQVQLDTERKAHARSVRVSSALRRLKP